MQDVVVAYTEADFCPHSPLVDPLSISVRLEQSHAVKIADWLAGSKLFTYQLVAHLFFSKSRVLQIGHL